MLDEYRDKKGRRSHTFSAGKTEKSQVFGIGEFGRRSRGVSMWVFPFYEFLDSFVVSIVRSRATINA